MVNLYKVSHLLHLSILIHHLDLNDLLACFDHTHHRKLLLLRVRRCRVDFYNHIERHLHFDTTDCFFRILSLKMLFLKVSDMYHTFPSTIHAYEYLFTLTESNLLSARRQRLQMSRQGSGLSKRQTTLIAAVRTLICQRK